MLTAVHLSASRSSAPMMAVSRQPQIVTDAQQKMLKREAAWKPGEVAPEYLDGSLPGDNGFDPLFLAALARKEIPALASGPWSAAEREAIMRELSAEEAARNVQWMVEAEIKHARLVSARCVLLPHAVTQNDPSIPPAHSCHRRCLLLWDGRLLSSSTLVRSARRADVLPPSSMVVSEMAPLDPFCLLLLHTLLTWRCRA